MSGSGFVGKIFGKGNIMGFKHRGIKEPVVGYMNKAGKC